MMHSSTGSWQRSKAVLVVDDHPVVRRGVRALIEDLTPHRVVGEADCGGEAVALAQEVCPDVIVIDVSMPGIGGIETLGELRRRVPEAGILVFTCHESAELCTQAIEAGARGFVCKSESEHLVAALEAVARHQAYFSPAVREARELQSGDEAWAARRLTVREREIVQLIAQGHSNKDIARILNISMKTADSHRASAMRKTGAHSASKLTLYAARNGLVAL